MNAFFYIMLIALAFGFLWLLVFIWSLKSGQYDDMDGAARRILIEDENTKTD